MTEGVIFDLEGTLVRLPIDYEALHSEIKRELHLTKVRPLTETVKILDQKSRDKLYKLWEHAEMQALPNSKSNEEGMELLRKHSNKPIALVTMQGRTVVKKILNYYHLPFRITITREDTIDRRAQIEKAICNLNLEPRNVLVIGDRKSDQISAKLAGCEFVMVRT
ncbi:MAG: HAD-IA family hydrolase [Candidatus Bathyarchaeota archaeon]|nr:HAD-IA family hydrolase [Candidatus Bathyarchaeota archaeon]